MRTCVRAFFFSSVALGCGGGRDFGDGGPDASVDLDAGLQDATFGDSFTSDADGRTCSLDLHAILDTEGNVVATCPPDQGCMSGQCVGACQAAAAAHGTVGCDFIVATPSFVADGKPINAPPCFAIFLANNWASSTGVAVSRGGTSYNPSTFGFIASVTAPVASWQAMVPPGIPYNHVGVLFMDADPKSIFLCPKPTAVAQGTAVDGTGRGKAWHITTTSPVSAYDILPFGGSKSALPGATLLYPTSAWGTNYIAALPQLGSGSGAPQAGPHWGQIVAMTDNTTVDVVPTVDLPSGINISAGPQNVKTTYTLSAGEYIQWQAPYSSGSIPAELTPMDMSGSIISSNQPIAFNGGNGYLCLGSATSGGGGCDSDHEQIAPISALGNEYAVVPFEPRPPFNVQKPESVIYRMVGVVDQTSLMYDPPVAVAPSALSLGQVVDFETTERFVVRSQDAQHPFHVAMMMSGCAGTSGLGDEDYIQVVPPAQFLTSYVFYADTTYGTTNVTVVRKKTSAGFADVKIDCVGIIGGWKPVDAADTYEYAWVDLVKGNVSQYNNCQNGPHTSSSTGPFGLTIWGEEQAASYGYPVGGNLIPLNTVIVPPVPK